MNVIQFLPDIADAFTNIQTLLKPNGMAATTCQPRTTRPSRAEMHAMTERIETPLINAGFWPHSGHPIDLRPFLSRGGGLNDLTLHYVSRF